MAEVEQSSNGAKRRRGQDLRLIARFWPLVRNARGWLGISLLALPVMTVAGLAQPWLVGKAIDGPIRDALAGLPETLPWTLGSVAAAYLVAVLAEYGARSLQLFGLQKLGFLGLHQLRRAVYRHVVRQGGRFFDTRATGTLLSRTTSDVEAVGEVLTFGIVGIVGDVIDIVAMLWVMVALDARLTGVSLLLAPVVIGVVALFRRQLRNYSGEIRRSMGAASGYFQEAIAGARVVQLHGRQQATVQEYKDLNYKYLDAYRLSNWYDASLYAVMDGVAALCVALLIWYGGGRALLPEGHADAVTVGLLVMFIGYIQRLFIPVRELSGKVATIERALAALERIFALLDSDEAVASGSHAPAEVLGDVRLQHVHFSYDGRTEVLHDVSLAVGRGQVLALVGPTGSGKSTVAKLLTRMYAGPNEAISLDGIPVEQWSTTALRRAIGVVQQDVVLFSGTLRDNVDLGRGTADPQLDQALRDACLGEVLDRLGGLDGKLGEGGGSLSAGERQLLAIARILAANPAVVVLDEATASVDSQTEALVQAAIERVLQGRTAVVVAHRLSTVRRADQIAVLRHGRLVEIGNHEQLLENGGLYAELVAAGERQGQLD